MKGNERYDTSKALERLETAIRARVPLVGIQSSEENRILGYISQLVGAPMPSASGNIAALPRMVMIWTYTNGIQVQVPDTNDEDLLERYAEAEEQFMGTDRNPTFEPRDAIEDFITWAKADGTIPGMDRASSVLVLCDIHRFLAGSEAGGANSIETIRALRDLFAGLQATKSLAILLAPTLTALGDSGDEIVTIDFPLPTTAELAAMVRTAAKKAPIAVTVSADIHNGEAEELAQALAGVTWTQAGYILRQAMVKSLELSAGGCGPLINKLKAESLKRNQGITLEQPIPMEDIGGLDLLKKAVQGYPKFMTPKAEARGIRPPASIMFAGPPGVGKSRACQAIGGGLLPIIRWSPAESKSKYVGESAANVRKVLDAADAIDQVVLWIDEVDLVFGDGEGQHEVSNELLQMMLTWMQERTSRVIVVMTTNHPERLPAPFRDRCEDAWFVDLPGNTAEAREVLDVHLRLNNIDGLDDAALNCIAVATVDGSLNPRNIAVAVQKANRLAFYDGDRKVTIRDLTTTIEEKISVSAKSAAAIQAMREDAKTWAMPASSVKRVARAKPEPVQGGEIDI